jgi:signal peptidase I
MAKHESREAGGTGAANAMKRKTTPQGWVQQVCQCIVISVLAMTSYLVISHFFLQSVTVMGRSMVPTLYDSQHYLLNRWVYLLRSPHCGEVVVLRDLIDNSFAVKRIVAGPSDAVEIHDGNVLVNGHALNEPYLAPGTKTYPCASRKEQSFHCGADEYFLLGDNRMNSADSRVYGPVARGRIVGLIIR